MIVELNADGELAHIRSPYYRPFTREVFTATLLALESEAAEVENKRAEFNARMDAEQAAIRQRRIAVIARMSIDHN